MIGALYGDRRSGGSSGGFPRITEFEAKLVELLASGIAAGLARLKEEQARRRSPRFNSSSSLRRNLPPNYSAILTCSRGATPR